MGDPGIWVAATAAEIRAVEDEVLQRVGEDPLMDLAADAVAAEARTMLQDRGLSVEGSRVVLLVGTGNNGGDALLAGAILAAEGATVTAVRVGDRCHDRGGAVLTDRGGTILAASEKALETVRAADLVVDGIVGIGANPGLREPARMLVGQIPTETPVLAVDLPSGLDPDQGTVDASHIRATSTVTFTCPKPCLLLPPAALVSGRVVVADVGIPLPEPAPDAPRRLTPAGAAALWPVPRPSDDKYSRGVVGVIAGSDRYPGAAVLACSAAVRSGAGMVRYLGPRRVQDLVLGARPEVVAEEPPDEAGSLPRVSAWVLGPGMADDPAQSAAAAWALASGLPAVVDAGAIDACVRARVAGHRQTPADRLLLTPHAGELGRALDAAGIPADARVIGADPAAHARRLAEAVDATVLLKGSVTLIAAPDGTLFSQAEAPPWLATAGAGDVLAGLAGTLLASGLPADRAGALAAFVHGRAAALASSGGPISALDVAEALPRTLDALPSAVRDLLSPGASSEV